MKEKETLQANQIGQLLQASRERAGVTQAEMATYTGISKNHVSAIERGINKVNVDVLLGYCGKLEISPNELLNISTDGITISLDLKEQLARLSEADQHKLAKILDIALSDK